jgi:DNA (cytosine-5)-methyltransferase 1
MIPEMAKLTLVSLFTGAMGLDLGFEKHGFEVRVALDNDTAVGATIQANHRTIPVVTRNLSDVTTPTLLESAGLKVGEVTVVTGAPPCEPFTTAGARNGFRDHRANAIHEFIRVVGESRPQYFVFEEVPGFLRAAKRHIPFYERAKMKDHEIDADARLGSAFEEVMQVFQSLGYRLSFNANNPKSSLLNSADYGSPQKRIRFVLIGALHGPPITLPRPTHAAPESTAVSAGERLPWATLRDALAGLDSNCDEWVSFPEKWGQYLHRVPPGGCWRDLPTELHPVVLGGAHDDGTDPNTAGMKGGRTGFLRRLSWDRPSPTLVDRPTNKANCLCHPNETRPLSVKEYARIQGFDDHWKFSGSLSQRYRLIGQATPIHLSAAVAARILEHRMGNAPENGHEEAHYPLIPLETQLEMLRDQVLR